MWILLECKTPFVLETAEVPQNFCRGCVFIENLWRLNQLRRDIDEAALTIHGNGLFIMKGPKEYKLDNSGWLLPFVSRSLGVVSRKR